MENPQRLIFKEAVAELRPWLLKAVNCNEDLAELLIDRGSTKFELQSMDVHVLAEEKLDSPLLQACFNRHIEMTATTGRSHQA